MQKHFSIGKKLLDIGEKYLPSLKKLLDIGRKYLDLGKKHLDIGRKYLDIGEKHLDIRKKYSDIQKNSRYIQIKVWCFHIFPRCPPKKQKHPLTNPSVLFSIIF